MKADELKQIPIEELLKSQKSLKSATNILAGVLICLFLVILYGMYKDGGVNVLIGVPLGLSVIVFRNIKTLKSLKTEIEFRNR